MSPRRAALWCAGLVAAIMLYLVHAAIIGKLTQNGLWILLVVIAFAMVVDLVRIAVRHD